VVHAHRFECVFVFQRRHHLAARTQTRTFRLALLVHRNTTIAAANTNAGTGGAVVTFLYIVATAAAAACRDVVFILASADSRHQAVAHNALPPENAVAHAPEKVKERRKELKIE
jgi:hypothetical protein